MTDELEPGKYTVTATIRQTVFVEPGEAMTEIEAVAEALEHPGHELVDWEVTRGGHR